MDYTTINEKRNIVLGYDTIGKEYFIWDKTNSKWHWYKTLGQANMYFNEFVSYLERK